MLQDAQHSYSGCTLSLLGCTGNSDKIGDKLQELFWNYSKEWKQDRRVRGKVREGKRDTGGKGAERIISSTRVTFLSSVVFFGQPSLALGKAVQAGIWRRSFAWPFCIPCYLISSSPNKQETPLQGLYIYLNGAHDDPVERMASLLDSIALLLYHGRSFPSAISVLLLSHTMNRLLPALKQSQAHPQPRMASCHPGLEKALQLEQRHCSTNFLQWRNTWMFLISRKLLVVFVGCLPKIYYHGIIEQFGLKGTLKPI